MTAALHGRFHSIVVRLLAILAELTPDTKYLTRQEPVVAVNGTKTYTFGFVATSGFLYSTKAVVIRFGSGEPRTLPAKIGFAWRRLSTASVTLEGVQEGTEIDLWAQGK